MSNRRVRPTRTAPRRCPASCGPLRSPDRYALGAGLLDGHVRLVAVHGVRGDRLRLRLAGGLRRRHQLHPAFVVVRGEDLLGGDTGHPVEPVEAGIDHRSFQHGGLDQSARRVAVELAVEVAVEHPVGVVVDDADHEAGDFAVDDHRRDLDLAGRGVRQHESPPQLVHLRVVEVRLAPGVVVPFDVDLLEPRQQFDDLVLGAGDVQLDRAAIGLEPVPGLLDLAAHVAGQEVGGLRFVAEHHLRHPEVRAPSRRWTAAARAASRPHRLPAAAGTGGSTGRAWTARP